MEIKSSQELGLNGDFRITRNGVDVPAFLSNRSREALRYAATRKVLRDFVGHALRPFDPKSDADNFSTSTGFGTTPESFDSVEWIRVFLSCIPLKIRDAALDSYEEFLRSVDRKNSKEYELEKKASALLLSSELGANHEYFLGCIEEMQAEHERRIEERDQAFVESERWVDIRQQFEAFPFFEEQEQTPGFFWSHLPTKWAVDWVVRRVESPDVTAALEAEGLLNAALHWVARWTRES